MGMYEKFKKAMRDLFLGEAEFAHLKRLLRSDEFLPLHMHSNEFSPIQKKILAKWSLFLKITFGILGVMAGCVGGAIGGSIFGEIYSPLAGIAGALIGACLCGYVGWFVGVRLSAPLSLASCYAVKSIGNLGSMLSRKTRQCTHYLQSKWEARQAHTSERHPLLVKKADILPARPTPQPPLQITQAIELRNTMPPLRFMANPESVRFNTSIQNQDEELNLEQPILPKRRLS